MVINIWKILHSLSYQKNTQYLSHLAIMQKEEMLLFIKKWQHISQFSEKMGLIKYLFYKYLYLLNNLTLYHFHFPSFWFFLLFSIFYLFLFHAHFLPILTVILQITYFFLFFDESSFALFIVSLLVTIKMIFH